MGKILYNNLIEEYFKGYEAGVKEAYKITKKQEEMDREIEKAQNMHKPPQMYYILSNLKKEIDSLNSVSSLLKTENRRKTGKKCKNDW